MLLRYDRRDDNNACTPVLSIIGVKESDVQKQCAYELLISAQLESSFTPPPRRIIILFIHRSISYIRVDTFHCSEQNTQQANN